MIIRRSPIAITPELSATLDFFRWTSAMAVLVGHIRLLLFPPADQIAHVGLVLKMFFLVAGFGNQAVIIFFVLSGFLVGGRAVEKIREGSFHPGNYLADRVSRIYPVLFVSLLLTAALDLVGVMYFHNANHDQRFVVWTYMVNYNLGDRLSGGVFLSNMLMLQGLVTPPFGTNGPLWSLSMEFWYYLLFPLLLIPFFTKSARTRRVVIIVLVMVLILLAKNPQYYSLFVIWLLGVAARSFYFPMKNSAVAFVILASALANSRFGWGSEYVRDLLIGVGCMWVIIAIQNGGRGIVYGASFSRKMADFSYSIYCSHFPVMILAVAVLAAHQEISSLSVTTCSLLTAALTAVCLGTSYAISLCTEARTSQYRQILRAGIRKLRDFRRAYESS